MKRPVHLLTVRISGHDLLAARKSGMVPNAVLNAVWTAIEQAGQLELFTLEQDCAEYNRRKDAENIKKAGKP